MRSIAEKELWCSQLFDICSEQQSMIHKDRVSFNFGAHMGFEMAKEKTKESLEQMVVKLLESEAIHKVSMKNEIATLRAILNNYDNFGERLINVE